VFSALISEDWDELMLLIHIKNFTYVSY
jgi:hypothetical protein